MSGGGDPTTSTQTTEPWAGSKPYYSDLYKTASDAFQEVDRSKFEGQLVADRSPYSLEAQQKMLGTLPQQQKAGESVFQLASDTASGMYMDPASNPFLQSSIEAAQRPTITAFNEEIMPSLRSAAVTSGAYGGTRDDVARGIAAGKLGESLNDTAAKIAYQNYATERGYQQTAPQQIAQALGLLSQPAQTYAQIGAADEMYNQTMLDAELARYNANALASMRGLNEYANILGSGGFNTSTGQIQGGGSSGGGWGGAAQGAAGGAMAGSTFGPWGTAIGAVGGAIAGGLA